VSLSARWAKVYRCVPLRFILLSCSLLIHTSAESQTTPRSRTTQPVATQPATTQAAATQPAAAQPTATQPVATQPATTQAAVTQPAAAQPVAAQSTATQPATTQAAVTQPAATQPVATQPATTQTAVTQPAATQPVAAQPTATQPVATQPATTQAAVTQPGAAQPTAGQPKAKAGTAKAPAVQAAEIQPPAVQVPVVHTVVAPAPAVPGILSAAIFRQPSIDEKNPKSNFVIEISGTNFDKIDMAGLRILVFPSTDVGSITALARSTDNDWISGEFIAPNSYALQQVALSLSGASYLVYSAAAESCDFDNQVIVQAQIVPRSQSKSKYGNGVANNFHVVQVSIVNKCSVPIIVPLAGISISPKGTNTSSCGDGGGNLTPFSLDHVTSIYSANRKLTGARAIYFNSIQALATLGSAVEPFFAHGFTQGVAILGGGFTTASKELSVDMSTEQLQNITSQSFGTTEQISSGGSLQRFIFIRRNQKCKDSIQEQNIRSGNFDINLEMVATSAQTPAAKSTPATPSAPAAVE